MVSINIKNFVFSPFKKITNFSSYIPFSIFLDRKYVDGKILEGLKKLMTDLTGTEKMRRIDKNLVVSIWLHLEYMMMELRIERVLLKNLSMKTEVWIVWRKWRFFVLVEKDIRAVKVNVLKEPDLLMCKWTPVWNMALHS